MQTRLGSFIEQAAQITIAYIVALLSQPIVFPLFDISLSMLDNLGIAACFTLISLVRGYIVRRVFTHYGIGYDSKKRNKGLAQPSP